MKYRIKVQFGTPKVADIAATHAVRTTTLKHEKVKAVVTPYMQSQVDIKCKSINSP